MGCLRSPGLAGAGGCCAVARLRRINKAWPPGKGPNDGAATTPNTVSLVDVGIGGTLMTWSGILKKTAAGLGAVTVSVVLAVAGAGQASADPGICVTGPWGWASACVNGPGWVNWGPNWDGGWHGGWHHGWGHGWGHGDGEGD